MSKRPWLALAIPFLLITLTGCGTNTYGLAQKAPSALEKVSDTDLCLGVRSHWRNQQMINEMNRRQVDCGIKIAEPASPAGSVGAQSDSRQIQSKDGSNASSNPKTSGEWKKPYYNENIVDEFDNDPIAAAQKYQIEQTIQFPIQIIRVEGSNAILSYIAEPTWVGKEAKQFKGFGQVVGMSIERKLYNVVCVLPLNDLDKGSQQQRKATLKVKLAKYSGDNIVLNCHK